METYGIDSVMVLQLTHQLEKHLGILPKTLFFEYQTIRELTGYFLEAYHQQIETILGIAVEKTAIAAAIAFDDSKFRVMKEPIKSVYKGYQYSRFDWIRKDTSPSPLDIAIIGIAGRYPQARNLQEFWVNLRDGKDCISEIPEERWDYRLYFDENPGKAGKSNSKWGGFLRDIDEFDPLFFNIPPREAELMDPQERLFLECVWHTLEDAGYSREGLAPGNIGVFVGVMWGQYQLFETNVTGTKISGSSSYASIANRVSYYLNLHGPSIALDTMCSSSFTAIHLACESIRNNNCEMAIAGGINLSIHPNKYLLLSRNHFLSSDGRCHSFGANGDGYVPGEGLGAVLLKPVNRAVADGDHIYAVIKGSAINHGGKTNGYTVPNPNAQTEVVTKALEQSQIDSRTISYIEAHGTGTALGDPIEITGLIKAFREYTQDRQYCAIGSAKSNIGHLEAAAGIAGLTKVIFQMNYKQLVPSLHVSHPNPNIDFIESPFYLQSELTEWPQPVEVKDGRIIKYPRRAGISSFGAGGANAHLIVEEYQNPENDCRPIAPNPQLFILSAKNEERLKHYAGIWMAFLDEHPDVPLLDLAYSLQIGREAMEERLALIVSSLSVLKERLNEYCQGKSGIPDLYHGNIKTGRMKTEFLTEGRESAEFLKIIITENKLHKLAKLWISGALIDWRLLYDRYPILRRRLSLPVYPFSQERYWLPGVKSFDYQEPQSQNNDAPSSKRFNLLDQAGPGQIPFEETSSNIQVELLNLFSNALKIPVAQIDTERSLADYGVDSILLMELMQRLENLFDAKMEPSLFLEYPTLQALGAYLQATYSSGNIRIAPKDGLQTGIKSSWRSEMEPSLELNKKNSYNTPETTTAAPGGPVVILGSTATFPREAFQNYWKNTKAGIPASLGVPDLVSGYLQLSAKYEPKLLQLLVETAAQQKIEVIISGQGPTLLLINGFGLTAPQWFYQIQDLSSRYQLVVIHNPGTGLSDSGVDCSFSGISKIYLEVLNQLPVKWPVHVIGASWGGMIAQTLALEYPERIASLVLAGSLCRFNVDLNNYRLRELFQKDFDNETNRPYYPLVVAGEVINPLAIPLYFENAKSQVSLLDSLPRIKIPTLVITGKQDQVVDPEESRLIHSQIPDSQFYEFEDAGHLPNLTHHLEFNQVVTRFIDSQIKKANAENQRWYVFQRAKDRARLRLFCFHSGLEGASLYRWWHTKLPPEIEVCPIQMPGRENRAQENPITDLEEALHTLERVLIPKLDLPYVFYGHRLGALIAFQLAVRLRNHQWPGFKSLLVGACAGPRIYPNLYLKSALLQFRAMGYRSIPGFDKIEELMVNHQPELLKIPVLKFNGIRNSKMIRSFLPLVLSELKLMEAGQAIHQESTDFPITVFYGARDFLLSQKEAQAWRESTRVGFKIYSFPGDHLFLGEDQNQSEFIAILTAELTEILGS
jgi:surfactin synthase thioesterase subunit/3-oxoacyl-(acyl-carrier-protein) synthase/acyl carrier protein